MVQREKRTVQKNYAKTSQQCKESVQGCVTKLKAGFSFR